MLGRERLTTTVFTRYLQWQDATTDRSKIPILNREVANHARSRPAKQTRHLHARRCAPHSRYRRGPCAARWRPLAGWRATWLARYDRVERIRTDRRRCADAVSGVHPGSPAQSGYEDEDHEEYEEDDEHEEEEEYEEEHEDDEHEEDE